MRSMTSNVGCVSSLKFSHRYFLAHLFGHKEQVATMSVYAYFAGALFGQQFVRQLHLAAGHEEPSTRHALIPFATLLEVRTNAIYTTKCYFLLHNCLFYSLGDVKVANSFSRIVYEIIYHPFDTFS